MPVNARASNPTTIDPTLVYSLPALIEAVGISHGRLRDYAKARLRAAYIFSRQTEVHKGSCRD